MRAQLLFKAGDMDHRVDVGLGWKGKLVGYLSNFLCYLEGAVEPRRKFQTFLGSQCFLTVRLELQVYPVPNLENSLCVMLVILICVPFLGCL